jgi:hypothetical protein
VEFACATGQASCAITEDVKVSLAAVAATANTASGFFVKITTVTSGYTSPLTYVVSRYSATGCAEADYVDEDTVKVDESCNAQTTTTTDYAKIVLGTWPTYALSYGCPTGCASACDIDALSLDLQNSCELGDDGNYYSLTAYSTGYTYVAADDENSAATTSFYAFALIALLFAALF